LLLFHHCFTGTKNKNKKSKSENYDSSGVVKPTTTKKGKSKSVNYDSTGVPISSKSKSKSKGKIHPSQVITDYVLPDAKPDTAKNFTGIIKYRMTSDDPSSNDSIFIIFGKIKSGKNIYSRIPRRTIF
jgi:hypothetical protein